MSWERVPEGVKTEQKQTRKPRLRTGKYLNETDGEGIKEATIDENEL